MRLLVCGSRDWDDQAMLNRVLDEVAREFDIAVLIEGEAKGADTLARYWAERRGIPVKRYPANWSGLGKAAGPLRNRQMLEEGKPDLVIAFTHDLEQSRGTKNMVTIARRAGVPTRVHP